MLKCALLALELIRVEEGAEESERSPVMGIIQCVLAFYGPAQH